MDTYREKLEAKLDQKLAEGKITVDENGIARNCIGRVLMDDMLEKLTYITDTVDEEATKAARDEEVSRSLEAYRKSRAGRRISEEERTVTWHSALWPLMGSVTRSASSSGRICQPSVPLMQ